MSGYTPAPHESRARFIAGSIDLIQRRDVCTLAEAEETAIGEWERWMEWHNVRVRRGVASEGTGWEARTSRGFGYTLIRVSNYQGEEPVDFTVQMSSLATEPKVWIGTDGHRAHMNVEEATRARDALSSFLAAVEQEGQPEI